MATQKTVNITSGKVLNYTITADGYKTVTGSKVITGNTTININMVPSTSEDNIFVLGDRIGDCATFVDYFDAVDPNTQETEKLAVFVVDAKWRTAAMSYSSGGYQEQSNNWGYCYNHGEKRYVGLPYSTDQATTLNMRQSATYSTQFMIDNYDVMNDTTYKAWKMARNARTISILDAKGNTQIFSTQLPTLWQLGRIFANKDQLDTFDPTLINYPKMSLSDWLFGQTISSTRGGAVSCNEYDDNAYWNYSRSDSNTAQIETFEKSYGYSYLRAVVPVFEIPVKIFQAEEESGN